MDMSSSRSTMKSHSLQVQTTQVSNNTSTQTSAAIPMTGNNNNNGNRSMMVSENEAPIILEGWLSKRSRGVATKVWHDRYFFLRGRTLSYFMEPTDATPRGMFHLSSSCAVSDIYLRDKRILSKISNTTTAATSETAIATESSFSSTEERTNNTVSSNNNNNNSRNNSNLYCIEITWLKHHDATDTESSHRLITKECGIVPSASSTNNLNHKSSSGLISIRSVHPSSSFSYNTISFTSPEQQQQQQMQQSNHVEPITTTTSSSIADTDSCPPTPVTEHKSYNRTKTSSIQNIDNSNIPPPNITPTRHGSFPFSIFRKKKPQGVRSKQNYSAMVVELPPSSSSHVGSQHVVSKLSPLRLKFKQENSSSLGTIQSLPELYLPELNNTTSSGAGAGAGGLKHQDDSLFHGGRKQSSIATIHMNTSTTTAIEDYQGISDSNLPMTTTATTTSITSGPTRHYTQQMEELQRKIQLRHETRLRFEQLQVTQKQNQQKHKRVKRIVRTGEYVAAVGGAITIGVFTAGIGWVVGLVFLCVSAAAGSSCAMAELGYLWNKPKAKYKLVLAAETMEMIQEWKDAIEYIIACLLEEECVAFEEERQQQQARRIKGGDDSPRGDVVSNFSNTSTSFTVDRSKDLISTLSSIPFSSVSRWEPLEGGWPTLLGVNSLGMRIFREETATESATQVNRSNNPISIPRVRRILRLGIQGRPSPPVKTQVIVKADPLDAFMCIMTRMNYDDRCAPLDKGLVPNSGQRASLRIIETIDDNSDIIHLFFRPIYLFPVWTLPRDFVLFRYWRNESDGSYTIMYDSIEHEKCPPMEGYIRGLMNGIYTIAPPSRTKRSKQGIEYLRSLEGECLLTHVVQVDPRGRIPNLNLPFFASEGYTEAFAVSVLSLVLDIRDTLDHARFVSVPLDDAKPPAWKEAMNRFRKSVTVADSKALLRKDDDDDEEGVIEFEDDDNHYDPRFSIYEVRGRARTLTDADTPSVPSELTSSLFSTDPPTYPLNQWAEPEGNSFRVRGKTYKTDGVKINAGDSLFPLLAVDLVETDAVLSGGLCSHPLERVQKALAREREAKARGLSNSDMPAFVFCVDIVLAGPPTVHMAFFYGVDDISKIDGSNGTPSSLLAKEFFFGESDEYRNSTFKLIPRIVEGNFLVRKAAGSTPAILGKKIKQTYIRSDRYFELIVETGSNPVSAGVLRLCSSYSKYLTADMAFLLEGNDESTLPEKILGCARVKNIDLNRNVRYVGMQDRS